MYEGDDSTSTHVPAQTFAKDLAEKAGKLVGVSSSFVYRAYKEWREGQEEHAIRAKEKGKTLDSNKGYFLQHRRGSYERRFLLHEEDLKIKFKKWMRENLSKLTVDLVWEYLNTKLLKNINEETLLAHRISLPISKGCAWNWMKKCGGNRMGLREKVEGYVNEMKNETNSIKIEIKVEVDKKKEEKKKTKMK